MRRTLTLPRCRACPRYFYCRHEEERARAEALFQLASESAHGEYAARLKEEQRTLEAVQTSAASKLCQSVLRRWQLRQLGSSYAQWRATAQFERRRELVVRRVVTRLRRLKLSCGFQTWAERARGLREEEGKRERVARRTVARMRNALLAGGFNTWKAGSSRVGTERRAVRAMERAVRRWNLQVTSSGFARWIFVTAEERHAQRQVIAAEEHRRSRAALEAESASRLAAEQLRHAVRTERTAAAVCAGILRRWTQRRLAAGLLKWKAVAVDEARRRVAATRCLSRMRQRELARAMGAWRAHLAAGDAQIRACALLRRAVARWSRKKLVRGMTAWKDAVVESRATMRAAALDRFRKTSEQIQCEGASELLKERQVASKFKASMASSLLARVVRRWKHRRLSGALRLWRAAAAGKALSNLRRSAASLAVTLWRTVAGGVAERERHARAVAAMRRGHVLVCAGQPLTRSLGSIHASSPWIACKHAFERWRTTALASRGTAQVSAAKMQGLLILLKTVRRMHAQRSLLGGFSRWRSAATDARRESDARRRRGVVSSIEQVRQEARRQRDRLNASRSSPTLTPPFGGGRSRAARTPPGRSGGGGLLLAEWGSPLPPPALPLPLPTTMTTTTTMMLTTTTTTATSTTTTMKTTAVAAAAARGQSQPAAAAAGTAA